MEELGQLRPDDVVQLAYPDAGGEAQSAWFLRITEDKGEGLKLKNAASERLVPVHPELERLGFVALALAMKELKHTRIFHELRPGAYGRLTAKWGEWFSSYRRDVCGVTDRRMVFHSFRHTFKDYARHASIAEGVQREIMGHSGDDVADDYGSGHSLFRLVEGMRLYRVPGLVALCP
jgi:integrase